MKNAAFSNQQKQFYTTKEFCSIFGVSRKTLYKFIKNGKLKAIKLGPNMIRLASEDIAAFLDSFR